MAKGINWLSILSAFVKDHPKTSATIAFNLGVFAAQTAKRAKPLAGGVVEIPAKLIELVPSMKDLSNYVPMIGSTKPATKRRRPAARKTVRKVSRTTTRRAAG